MQKFIPKVLFFLGLVSENFVYEFLEVIERIYDILTTAIDFI